MATIQSVIFVTALALTGCSSLPTCGTPEARPGVACSNSFASMLSEANASQPPTRNYITNPYYPATPAPAQPTMGSTAREEYRTVLVNTSGGLVYKRCKFLNDQMVSCL